MTHPRWQSALDRLYALANWETRPPGTELSFELDRIRRLLERLGQPQLRWPGVHVAGTNGKGSTSAMLDSVLREAGYRVGFFSSPHLHTLRERIRVDGEPISEGAVIDWLDRNEELLRAEPATTTFEALTALAFDHFARAEVDLAVIEVGLGGRLDTTNVLRPAVCAITPIGLDHVQVLGGDLASIARDKAGILKAGVPAAIAPQAPEARAVLLEEAGRVGSPLVEVDRRYRWSEAEALPRGQRFRLGRRDAGPSPGYTVELALPGAFQQVNAATAVASLELLTAAGWERIDPRAIERGLAATRWPARFEIFETDGFLGHEPSPRIVLDGAHNPHAARALAEALDARFADRPRRWILGFSHDKDVAALLAALDPGPAPIWTIRAPHPRAMAAAEAADRLRAAGLDARPAPSAELALRAALEGLGARGVLVGSGSIFAVAELRLAWHRLAGLPLPPCDPPPPSRPDDRAAR